MSSARRTAIAAGALLIVATGAALAAEALDPTLTGPDYLREVAGHPHQLAVATLLYLIAASTSVGIAVALYPLLTKVDAALALASVVFRTIEAVFYVAAVVSLLSILPLAEHLAAAPAADPAAVHALADTLLGARDRATLAGVFAFCVGALTYYVVFYRSRLVPRWLSLWGLAGTLALMGACLLALFHGDPVTSHRLLILPIAVQEMVLALWLLFRGFGPARHTSRQTAESSAAASGMTVRVN